MKYIWLILLEFILLITCAIAQNKLETLGNVLVEVKKGKMEIRKDSDFVLVPSFAKDSVFFYIPIKEKIPLFLGGTQQIFFCYHCINYEVTTSVFKNNNKRIKLSLVIKSDRGEYFAKKVSLKKGQSKMLMKNGFSLKCRYE